MFKFCREQKVVTKDSRRLDLGKDVAKDTRGEGEEDGKMLKTN